MSARRRTAFRNWVEYLAVTGVVATLRFTPRWMAESLGRGYAGLLDRGRAVEEYAISDGDAPRVRLDQSGNAVKRKRLARTGGADQCDDPCGTCPVNVQREPAELPLHGDRQHDGPC